MLKGYFDNLYSRPYFDGVLKIPRLGISGPVSFLVDTGSDCTVLMPKDIKLLGIKASDFKRAQRDPTVGAGGISMDYLEPAHVLLSDPKAATYHWNIDLRISMGATHSLAIPSILGRDIIDRLSMTYDRPRKCLQADVFSANKIISLAKNS